MTDDSDGSRDEPAEPGATVVDRPGAPGGALVDTADATAIARPGRSAREPARAAATVTGGPAARSRAGTPSESTTVPAPRLDLSDILGVGGMGIVFRAHQTDLGRPIAFKRLMDAPSEEMRARFVREARLTAQLDHPNIVPVHLFDPGSDGVPSGYAMKLVEGATLAALIREVRTRTERGEPLDDDHAVEARLEHFLKVCDAIAFAHDRGIIHRDIKPGNVMIGPFGAVYVMDWGIARPIGRGDEHAPAASPHADGNAKRNG